MRSQPNMQSPNNLNVQTHSTHVLTVQNITSEPSSAIQDSKQPDP